MISINTNASAVGAMRLLGQSNSALAKSLARLSSGSRINSPEDDPAGLSESMTLRNESIRHKAAIQNLANSVSFLQTKDGYLQKIQKALDRMSELSMAAMDATKTDEDRSSYDSEFQALKSFIDDAGGKTFNGKSLFYSEYQLVDTGSDITWTDAEAAARAQGGHLAAITSPGEQNYIVQQLGGTVSLDAWIGATDQVTEGQFQWSDGEPFSYSSWNSGEPNNLGNEDYAELVSGTSAKWNDYPDDGYTGIVGVKAYLLEKGPSIVINGDGDTIDLPTGGVPYITDSITSTASAKTALTNLKSNIEYVSQQRALVGSTLERVQSESDSLSTEVENLDTSVSRIADTDAAQESTQFSRLNILVQSGIAMLAQANTAPQMALRLLAA